MALFANIFAALKGSVTSGYGAYLDDRSAAPLTLTDGNGNGQAQKWYSSKGRSLALSTSENLDLSGALVDVVGASLVLTFVKAIIIKADPGNTNDVIVGNAATNQFVGPFGAAAHTVAVKPGGTLMMIAPNTGWAVVAGTGDLLKILNGGAGSAVIYDIDIIGY